MKVPVHIAEKLLLLLQGESVPSSLAKHSLMDDLVSEGIIVRKGRIQKSLLILDSKALNTYLQNICGISDLQQYITTIKKEGVIKSELIAATSNSKHIAVRSFKGFLINCYNPIEAILNGKKLTLTPVEGCFQFVYDFENFSLPSDVTIVGIENPENFRHIHKQKYLFTNIKPLFVSRYPQNQSKDLIKWLQNIPNKYTHYGDFDLAGINIYLNEIKKYVNNKSTFFIPNNIEHLIKLYGNREIYNKQKPFFKTEQISEKGLLKLLEVIHTYRKGLEQEILINTKE